MKKRRSTFPSTLGSASTAHSITTRRLAKIIVVLHLWQIAVPSSLAYAQDLAVTPDRSAPAGQRPLMDAAPNGVPLVHIAPPSAGGVSRNQYEQFSVNPNGVILNNATSETQTQLGGWVSTNVQLGPSPARVILNEVTSTQPSQLRGVIEVAGHRADIVLANPNGITCDGCGFLNSPRATLSTGSPQFDANGVFNGLDVRQGEIMVGSGGLAAANVEQLDLIARGLVIEGEVWTQNLNALAGANHVLYGTLQAIPQTGTGNAPRFAIDIKNLGGMYANKIFMVATEKGFGVNSSGRLAALQGNLHLSANGDLTLSDTRAQTDLALSAQDNLTLTGTTSSGANSAIDAAGTFANQGELDAQGRLTVHAGHIANAGQLAHRSTEALELRADGRLENSGTLYSAGALSTTAQTLTDSGGVWRANGPIVVTAQTLNLGNTEVTGGSEVQLSATGGALTTSQIELNAGSTLRTTAAGELSHRSGRLNAADAITLEGASVVTSASQIQSGAELAITTLGALDNSGGTLSAARSVLVDAASLSNQSGSEIIAGGSAQINVSSGVDNRGSVISGATAVTINAARGAIENSGGTVVTEGALVLNGTSLNNAQGKLASRQDLNLTVSGPVNNTAGTVQTDTGALTLASGDVTNTAGQVLSVAGTATITANALDNSGGQVIARDNLTLRTGHLTNNAAAVLTSEAGQIDIQAAGASNLDGVIFGATGASFVTKALDNSRGEIRSGGSLLLNTQGHTLTNVDGVLQAQGAATVQSGSFNNQNGAMTGTGVRVNSAAFDNTAGTLVSAGVLSLNAQGIANDRGLLQSATALTLNAANATLANTNSGAGRGILAGTTLSVIAGALDNTAGLVLSGDDQSISLANDLTNLRGTVTSNGVLRVQAATVNNATGTLQAIRDLNLAVSGTADNTAGRVAGNGAIDLSATSLVNREAGTLEGRSLTLTANSIDNSGGSVLAKDNVTLNTAALRNIGGALTSERTLALTATALDNTEGRLIANESLTVRTTSSSPGGTLSSKQDLTLIIDGDFQNNGLLMAERDLTLQAGNLTNHANAVIAAGNSLTATANSLLNHGEINGRNVRLDITGTLTNATVAGARDALIDGDNVRIRAGTLDNTARLYGSDLRLDIGTLNNTGTGVVSARNLLAIGAGQFNNLGGAGVYSLDDLEIGGRISTFDVPAQPVDGLTQKLTAGNVSSFINGSSVIDISGHAAIFADKFENRNDTLTTRIDETVQHHLEIRPEHPFKTEEHIDISQFIAAKSEGDADMLLLMVDREKYFYTLSLPEPFSQQCDSNDNCVNVPNFAPDAPQFAEFNVTPPPPAPPQPVTDCAQNFDTACAAYDAWKREYFTAVAMLGAAIDQAHVASFHPVEDYEQFDFNRTTAKTAVDRTDPAKLLAGGSITVAGDFVNRDSHILAGGAFVNRDGAGTPVSEAIFNVSQKGQTTVRDEGETFFYEIRGNGGNGHKGEKGPISAYRVDEHVTGTFALPTVMFQPGLSVVTHDQDPANVGKTAATSASAMTTNTVAARTLTAIPVPALAPPPGSDLPPRPAGARDVILSTTVSPVPPTSSLFQLHAAPNARYLVETDPRFTRYDLFLSSDYFFDQLARDPERNLKRYGDGFYEQKLVDDQIMSLTGRRFLSGYDSTEAEYKALMDAGVAFAEDYQISPGVALTAEQLANLTTDIVWLTTQTVTLANGETQDVLVPQVYLRRPEGADLQPSGALIAANTIHVRRDANVINDGSIQADRAVAIGGHDVVNTGTVRGNNILLKASNDLVNLSGVIQGTGENSEVNLLAGRDVVLQTQSYVTVGEHGTHVASDRLATLQADKVTFAAERDVSAIGAEVLAEKSLVVVAGNDIKIRAAESGYVIDPIVADGHDPLGRPTYLHEERLTHSVSTFGSAQGDTTLVAGGTLSAEGANFFAQGDVTLQGTDVSVRAAVDYQSRDRQTASADGYSQSATRTETLAGGVIQAGGNAVIIAHGAGVTDAHLTHIAGAARVVVDGDDVNVVRNALPTAAPPATADANVPTAEADTNASEAKKYFGAEGTGNARLTGVQATAGSGQVYVYANNNVTIEHQTTTQSGQSESQTAKKRFLGSSASASSNDYFTEHVNGSVISGNAVTIQAGHDVTVQASQIVADQALRIDAGHDLTLTTAEERTQSESTDNQRQSGLFRSGDTSLTFGKQTRDHDQSDQSVNQVGATLGSLTGSVTLTAGNRYTQRASDVVTPQGDITVQAKAIDILAAETSGQQQQQTATKQSGLTLSVSNGLVDAAKTAQQMRDASGQTDDRRLQALALATTALSASNAADAVTRSGAPLGGVNASLTIGQSQTHSESTQTRTTAATSTLAAGGSIALIATGAGQDSNLTAVGATIQAGRSVALKADNAINLLAAQNTAEQHRDSQGGSAAFGVGGQVGGSGNSAGFTGSASAQRANTDGQDQTWTNTHVTAGSTLTIESGGDTTLRGAVAHGQRVVTDIGGQLKIESLQDTSTYTSQDRSLGGSVTVGVGVSGSVNASKGDIDSTYAAVTEQSGLFAGDSGFDVTAKQGTILKGGVITSTQTAIDEKRNRLETAFIVTEDIENHAEYRATNISLGAGYGPDVGKNQQGEVQSGPSQTPGTDTPKQGKLSATVPIVLGAQDENHTTTRSAISDAKIVITDATQQKEKTGETVKQRLASLNRDTANAAGTLAPIFDEQKIQTGMAITGAMSREVGTFIENRATEADAKKAEAKAAETKSHDPTLTADEQQTYRNQAAALRDEAKTIQDNWGSEGTYRQIATALTAAASGNVTGTTSEMMQSKVVNYVQQQGAGYIGDLVANGTLTEGSPEHAALHALVACAGAAAGNQNCTSGATGAAASSLLTGLFTQPRPDETNEQREAKRNLVATLVTGLAATTSEINPTTANNAAIAATDNNWLATQQVVQRNQELAACKDLKCGLTTLLKWEGISRKQDALTAVGLGVGLGESVAEDIQSLATLLAHPMDALDAIKRYVADENTRIDVNDSTFRDLENKIALIDQALEVGGDTNAVILGDELASLSYLFLSSVTGVKVAATAGGKLAIEVADVASDTAKTIGVGAEASGKGSAPRSFGDLGDAADADADSGNVVDDLTRQVADETAAVRRIGANNRNRKLENQIISENPGSTSSVLKNGGVGKNEESTIAPAVNVFSNPPLSIAQVEAIKALSKEERPDPSEYLSPSYIENHLAQFNQGASRIMTKRNFDKYGVGQSDGTSFVMTSREIDELILSSKGNPRALEKALGLPDNFLDSNELVRIDIPNPRELNLRIPSGRETGANPQWIPGGKLPDGNLEAVIDVKDLTPDRIVRTPLTFF